MRRMSTAYEKTGRAAQKQRTRAALVEAARALVAAGMTPTVEEAAAAAAISRTTAYRYFPSKRALLLAAHPEVGAASMLPADAPGDAASRLDLVVRAFTEMIRDTEAQQRTMLRISLDDAPEHHDLPLRQGRAIAWIGEALEVLRGRLADAELDQLVNAIRATVGIEALVWLVDIAGLSRQDAGSLMRWSAHALLEAALEHPPPVAARARSTTDR
jgi:AcrR family transcriptional regulator